MAHQHDHHDHSHAHGHPGHSHAPDSFGFAFAVGVALNTVFVVAELVFGYAANSLALISDAVHNFSDVIALLLAWAAGWLAGKRPTDQHTYGYRRPSIEFGRPPRWQAGPSFWSRRSASSSTAEPR
jgi:cobalt-zinc-cadmium efflux system protein